MIKPACPRVCRLALSAIAAGTPVLAWAQAQTVPLPAPTQAPAAAPIQRQTGMLVIEGSHDERTIVRTFEPDSIVGHYRVDFIALDVDGDGLVDRNEARAQPTLDAEFRAVDANNDGRLDRAELSGWMR
jgi:hypothetical protein